MFLGVDTVRLVNAQRLEKVILAKKVGQFLNGRHPDDDRAVVADVARMLAKDVSDQVREALAFELRNCDDLPKDIGESIARDVESVSGPFLATSTLFTDEETAALIPELAEHARLVIARRNDLGEQTVEAIVETAAKPTVGYVVRNHRLSLSERACDGVVRRFGGDRPMMDDLSMRSDLPMSIVRRIVDRISARHREALVDHYGLEVPVADRIAASSRARALKRSLGKASSAQVHAFVVDLRKNGQLNPELTAEMAEADCPEFMVSALALESGLPLGEVRARLRLHYRKDFVKLLKRAGVPRDLAPRYLAAAKKHFAAPDMD